MMRAFPILLVASAFALSGCGLRPLYSGGSTGTVATTLAQVDVAPMEGKAGWRMGNALRDRLHTGQGVTPRYRLEIKLDDKIIGLGIRRDDSISRERRTLRARYQLVDLSNGAVLLDAAARSDAGIDSVRSEYGTIAAENTALERLSQIVADQIVTRVATYVSRSGDRAAR